MLDWLEAQIVRLIELTERVTIALENIAQVLLAYDAAHGGFALYITPTWVPWQPWSQRQRRIRPFS